MSIEKKKILQICVVTAARSEYGLLKWLMHDIKSSDRFSLQLIVTGGHLSNEQGHTVDQIIEDGFIPNCQVDVQLNTTSTKTIAESMGRMAEKFARAFAMLNPDYVLILGDRYELLPICNTAYVMHIPIIHLSGGDVTEGAIDDGIRNAVTMLATYHFPGIQSSAENIIRMRGYSRYVWAVGEPGLDSFVREKMLDRKELAYNLGLDIERKWSLMTYHAETRQTLNYNFKTVKNIIGALNEFPDLQVVMTYANADYGGDQINKELEIASRVNTHFKVVPSLGHHRYMSLMMQTAFVVGNSSSGILETPFLKVPAINVGDRQKGRHQCANVIQVTNKQEEIKRAIISAMNMQMDSVDDRYYWGDGHTSEKIINILGDELI